MFRHVMVLAPLTPLENWVNESEKWIEDTIGSSLLQIYNLRRCNEFFNQKKEVLKWKKKGGVLLMNNDLFTTLCKKEDRMAKLLQPDVLVLDEAHTCLKNRNTKIYKFLNIIKTRRRILLTGTPLQNNLSELYNMMEYARSGVMDQLFNVESEKEFKKMYR